MLDVLVGRIGLIDARVDVPARRVPEAQQLADNGVLVHGSFTVKSDSVRPSRCSAVVGSSSKNSRPSV